MKAVISILPPVPLSIAQSYDGIGFGKFGVAVWQWQLGGITYNGPIQWINFLNTCLEPNIKNPVAFKYWFYPNVLYNVQVVPEITTNIADSIINGAAVNLITGKLMPLLLAP